MAGWATAIAVMPSTAMAQPGNTAGVVTTATPGLPSPSPSGASVVQSYPPTFFSRYAPRSALDMVRNLPDFRPTMVSDDRGIGQATENVLINGARVSGKSNDAQTELGRIAASAVERIDIVDGATLGIPGLSGRVANVVVASSRIGVQYHWDPQFRQNIEWQLFSGAISANGRIGASEVSLSLSNNSGARRAGVGPELGYLGNGTLALQRDEVDRYYIDHPRLAGSLRRRWGNGDVLNLNLSGETNLFRATLDGIGTPFDGSPRFTDRYGQRDLDQSVEGGGDFEFDAAGGRLKLITLQRFTASASNSNYLQSLAAPASTTTGTLVDRHAQQGESVARSEFSWAGGNWQVAVEGAYNFLRTRAVIGRRQADGSYPLNPLTGGSIFVDEWRGDSSVSHNFQVDSGITIQATVGAEYSRISYTGIGSGNNRQSRDFFRPKGSLSLAWQTGPHLTINARLQRRVGQLNFGEFAANEDLQNGASTATNGQLVPEQAWRIEASAVRSLGNAGSLTLGSYGEIISDIVDRIPLTATTEGVGNLPSARRWGVTVAGTLLLDHVGWHGGRIDAQGEFRESSVRDPVTSQLRSISNDTERTWSVQLRHDIPHSPIAWGFLISEDRNTATYRLDQTYRATLTNAVTQLYVEHKNIGGLTVRVTLRNLLGARDNIVRDYYVARRDGPLAYYERQLRQIHLIGLLTVSGSF